MIEKLQTREIPLPNNPAVVENIGMDNKSLFEKINELVDAVNRYEDIIRQIGEWGNRKGECLWCENITSINIRNTK